MARMTKEDWEEKLTQMELLNQGDSIEEEIKGDYYSFMSQNRGQYFFTREAIIFVGFGIERKIPYDQIQEMKKCFVGPFIPTGIQIVAKNEKGKLKKHKLSVLKRQDWMNYISAKSGVAVQ